MLEHLIKLQASPATEPRNGSKTSVLSARRRIRRILKSSLSLRREVALMTEDETPDVCRDVAETLAIYGEQPLVPIETLAFTAAQVLDSWFPDNAIA